MKQGTLINRIVMLLLLAAVLVYLGVSAWRSFRDPYTWCCPTPTLWTTVWRPPAFWCGRSACSPVPAGLWICCPRRGEGLPRGDGGPALPE